MGYCTIGVEKTLDLSMLNGAICGKFLPIILIWSHRQKLSD